MPKQILVIGLGQLGMSVAESLFQKGVEVLALDKNKELVDKAASLGIEAVQMDVTNDLELSKIISKQINIAICTIGEESKDSSIICTALMRQSGVSHIVSRSCNDIHERILKLVGAHLVVNPEKEFGRRLSTKLVYSKVASEMPLGNDLNITEINLPDKFIGRCLLDLSLPKKYEITVIAVRNTETNEITLPDPQKTLMREDNLIVISRAEAISKIMKVY
ncbi:MAG: TrkA family potassium uptake protein [Victivallales bacterium]|nr:TrkA family potassium uptake protein [Victivallales bacterium]MCF7889398.1 TrkA family potassium uptake protein [Victivallales bacterium]